MTLTLLARTGKYGILGNDDGATFLAEAADDDFWRGFLRPDFCSTRELRRLRAVPSTVLATGEAMPPNTLCEWDTVKIPIVDHGPIKAACYFERSNSPLHPNRWIVCRGGVA